jgi:uncharacterized membrane protein
MAINYVYLSFILNQLKLFSLIEYIVFICLFFFIISLLYSIILIFIMYRIKKVEKANLIKYEKLLINLKKSFDNGQINAKEYKTRITNINNKHFS